MGWGELLSGPGEAAGFLLAVVQTYLVPALCSYPGGGHGPFEKLVQDTIRAKGADRPMRGKLYLQVQMARPLKTKSLDKK